MQTSLEGILSILTSHTVTISEMEMALTDGSDRITPLELVGCLFGFFIIIVITIVIYSDFYLFLCKKLEDFWFFFLLFLTFLIFL